MTVEVYTPESAPTLFRDFGITKIKTIKLQQHEGLGWLIIVNEDELYNVCTLVKSCRHILYGLFRFLNKGHPLHSLLHEQIRLINNGLTQNAINNFNNSKERIGASIDVANKAIAASRRQLAVLDFIEEVADSTGCQDVFRLSEIITRDHVPALEQAILRIKPVYMDNGSSAKKVRAFTHKFPKEGASESYFDFETQKGIVFDKVDNPSEEATDISTWTHLLFKAASQSQEEAERTNMRDIDSER